MSKALLIVHGIGEQLRGQTTEKLIHGLSAAFGSQLAVTRDPLYSAAWKALGRVLGESAEAMEAYRKGIEAAGLKGDRQAEKEMTVFLRRLEKKLGGAA